MLPWFLLAKYLTGNGYACRYCKFLFGCLKIHERSPIVLFLRNEEIHKLFLVEIYMPHIPQPNLRSSASHSSMVKHEICVITIVLIPLLVLYFFFVF